MFASLRKDVVRMWLDNLKFLKPTVEQDRWRQVNVLSIQSKVRGFTSVSVPHWHSLNLMSEFIWLKFPNAFIECGNTGQRLVDRLSARYEQIFWLKSESCKFHGLGNPWVAAVMKHAYDFTRRSMPCNTCTAVVRRTWRSYSFAMQKHRFWKNKKARY